MESLLNRIREDKDVKLDNNKAFKEEVKDKDLKLIEMLNNLKL
jgi:hypothetical protein